MEAKLDSYSNSAKKPAPFAPHLFQRCGACGFTRSELDLPDFAYLGDEGKLRILPLGQREEALRDLGTSHNGATIRGRLYILCHYTCADCGVLQHNPMLHVRLNGICSLELFLAAAVTTYLVGWMSFSPWWIPLIFFPALLVPQIISLVLLNFIYFRRLASLRGGSCYQCRATNLVSWTRAKSRKLMLVCSECGEQKLTTTYINRE